MTNLTEEQSALLSAMYRQDEDADELPETSASVSNTSVPDRGIINMAALSSEVRRLSSENERLRRDIRQMQIQMSHLRRHMNSTFNDMRSDIDGKIDRREF